MILKKLLFSHVSNSENAYFHLMKWCYLAFILLLIGACSLSSSQEATLHKAVNSFVNAHNNGAVMAYVGCTHPNVVGYYENQGDSIFRQRFELFEPQNGGDLLQDGHVKEIEKNGKEIHVRYVFDRLEEKEFEQQISEIGVVAISLNDGETWFFAEDADYTNPKIFSKDEQLIQL